MLMCIEHGRHNNTPLPSRYRQASHSQLPQPAIGRVQGRRQDVKSGGHGARETVWGSGGYVPPSAVQGTGELFTFSNS